MAPPAGQKAQLRAQLRHCRAPDYDVLDLSPADKIPIAQYNLR